MSGIPRLKEFRTARGLRQTDLAELSNVPNGTISRLEKGLREPHMHTVKKLAAALDVELSALLDGESSASPQQNSDSEKEVVETAKVFLECLDTGLGDPALRLAQLRLAVAKTEGKA